MASNSPVYFLHRAARLIVSLFCVGVLVGCERQPEQAVDANHYDVLIHGGLIYDGTGGAAYPGDVAINADRIVAIGDLSSVASATPATADTIIDASGLAVAPGFINMLSWAPESLLVDGRSQSDIRQGVTLEIFGEGVSYGPLNDAMKTLMQERQSDIRFDIEWTTLGEYLDHLAAKGVSPNVASFVGATTVRVHEIGYEDRPPSAAELSRMQALVRTAMQEGALGLGSSLIYAPAFYADTAELVALAKVVGEYGGMYISHMRSEGNRLLESIDELIHVARESGAAAEIYHLKMSGQENWSKFDAAIARVEAARAEGLAVSADMYTYTAGATGLDAAMPPWVQEGGYDAWVGRLRDASIRSKVVEEMLVPTDSWENLGLAAGPEGMLLVNFRNPELRSLLGKTLAEVATMRGTSPADTAIDLVIEDGSRVGVVYFLMSEENVSRAVALPWVSFGSDAASLATEGVFLKQGAHPRAYGNFARVLGKYARDEAVISLELAVHKLSGLPAANLRLRDRGLLRTGFFADVVVFDPAGVRDHATYDAPHVYATGVRDVLVNGVAVLKDGAHTGALPGRVVRGPGWRGWSAAVEEIR